MKVEILVYGYLAVCVSMILYNCACIVVFGRRDRKLEQRTEAFSEAIRAEFERLESGGHVEESHKELLAKRLKKERELLAFDEALSGIGEDSGEPMKAYLAEIYEVFEGLAAENPYKDNVRVTYFAYVVGKYGFLKGRLDSPIMELMLRLLSENSIYCRENALAAIYSAGDCGRAVEALKKVEEISMFHSPKLLTDGLLEFAGDHDRLAAALWAEWESFSVSMQLVILDYFRFGGRRMEKELLPILADERRDDELRFSCIRYFGKYPSEAAYPLLLDFASRERGERWEYAAIAASALAAYPSERTVEVLKRNLNSSNWYVRLNAVKSLGKFPLTYSELSDVLEGNDRYAREILQYELDMEKLKRRQRDRETQKEWRDETA